MNLYTEAGETLNWLLNASLQAALLVPVILLVQWLLRHRLSARWRFALWWLLILRLLLPVSFASPWSLFNYVQPQVNLAGPQFSPPTTADGATVAPSVVGEAAPVRLANHESPPNTDSFAAELPQAVRPVEPSPATPFVASEPTEPARPAPGSRAFDAGDHLIPLIWAVWILVALALMAVVVIQSIAFSRRLRAARQNIPAPLNDLLADCRRIMGVRRDVSLLETEAVTSPVLYGLFRHRILLPWGFADRFSAVELRHVLLHELAHVKRGDLWLNWLVTALQIVHWFNPLVWLGFARLRADRELACDELALLRSGADTGRDYGRTMLKLLEDFARPKAMPGLVGILEDKQQMRRRVRMIARFRRPSRWSALALIPIAALGLVLLTDAQVREATPTEAVPSDSDTAADTVLRVLDDETGNPIAGAVINANHLQLVSDTEGVARIPMTEQMKWMRGVNIFITPVGYVPKVITWPWREEFFREYSVRLQPARTIGGIVVDEAGQPVPGVRINLPSPDISGQAGIEHIAYHPEQTAAYTDLNGRWEWPYLPRDATNFRFTLTATNYMATEVYVEVIDDLSRKHGIHGMQTIHLTNSLGLTDLKATIYRGFSLTGRVLGRGADRQLHPLAGALVREVHNHGYGHYRVQAITDDRGEFAMQGLRFQPSTLVAEAEGFSPAAAEIELHIGPNKHDFWLSKGPALKGRVLDSSGLPIPNALIRTDVGSQGIRLFNWTARSDAEGRFEWTHAPHGEVLYWFEADEFLLVRDRPLTADDTQHQIILERRDPPPNASVSKPIFELRLVESEANDETETLPVLTRAGEAAPANLQKLFVRKQPLLDVSALNSAKVSINSLYANPEIAVEFTSQGQSLFTEITRQHVGRQIAIVIDGQLISAPVIAEPITGGKAQITGNFSREEAERLAQLIQQNIARKSAGVAPFTGAIQGRVILDGKPPPERAITGMDPQSRAQHANTPTTQSYVVADDGGLKDVVVYLEGDLPPLASAADLPPLVIDHQHGFKVPYVSALAVGQTLLLTNSDSQLHNCHIIPHQGSGNREVNKALMRGVASSHTFTAPDHWVRLKCDVHPWEFAYVCVFPHRYFAVTDAGGHFSITNVPPGRYKLHALHRRALGDGPIEIEIEGGGLKVVPLTLRPEASNAVAPTTPVESRPAAAASSSQAPARFLEIITEIEFENWDKFHPQSDPLAHIERHRTRSVIGTNSWMIESDYNGHFTRWFTGTRIIARGDAITGYETGDTNPAGRAGVDGLMGFDLPAAVTWQAFGSGPAHRQGGAKLYPPGPLWEQARLSPAAWSESTDLFNDNLGLPKAINIFTTDGHLIYQYEVFNSTNVLGWSVPTGFRGMAYRQRPGRRPAMHLLFAARVTAISPVNELGIPEQGGQPNAPVASTQPSSATNLFNFGLVTPAQALDVYRELTGRELIVSTQVTNVAAFVGAKYAQGSREEVAKEIKALLLEQAGLVITELDGNRASVTHNEALSVKPLEDPTGRQPPPLGPDGKDVIKPDARPRFPPRNDPGNVENSAIAPMPSRPKLAQFLALTTEIEIDYVGRQPSREAEVPPGDSNPREHHRTRSVIGTNSWMIESDWNGRVTRWFTGTRIIARGDAITGYETGDTNPAGRAGVDDLMGFDLPAAVTWQAFGSGPAHRQGGAKLYPPSPFWEQARLSPAAWSERTELFNDSLGLPKSIHLVTADGESLYEYQVLSSTNVLGWSVPTGFKGVAYRQRPGGKSAVYLSFEARVTAISPVNEPGVPLP